MRQISNSDAQLLLRALPLVLDNIAPDALRKDLRLANAARRLRLIVKKLQKTTPPI